MYELHIKGTCSVEYAVLVAERARKQINLDVDSIKYCLYVHERIINFILK